MAKWQGKHWTIDLIPSRRKTPYRLRWKGLKSFGYPKEEHFGKDHYFGALKVAKKFAREKIEAVQYVGKLAAGLSTERRAEILRDAAVLESKGIDPLVAMAEGAKLLEAFGKDGARPIGDFWQTYVKRKKGSGKWGARFLKAQETFYDTTKDSFMKIPLKEFVFASSGRRAVREALEAMRDKNTRNAKNTIRGDMAKMRGFLLFVSTEVDALSSSAVREIFSLTEAVLPLGTRAEAQNVAIHTAQAKYLLKYLAERQLAGWAVFKIFMGARTLLLQRWHWSIVDWEDGLITIPRASTKLKASDIRFQIKEIPNFKEWLEWAWKNDGKPKPDRPIAPKSQPTITNHVKKAINENKGLFASDGRKKIKPSETHRNFMRSGFITYGLEKLPVGTVMRIAEDRHNLDKYVAWDAGSGSEPEAARFWALKPSDIVLEPVPKKERKPRRQSQAQAKK